MADDQGQGLFAKSGKDAINLGGHKIPLAAVAGAIALLGVIVVLRARSQRSTVAQVGQAPYTAAANGFGAPNFAPDYSGALANISAQLTALTGPGTGLNPAAQPMAMTQSQPAGFPSAGYGTIPFYLNPGGKLWSASDPTASGNLPTWLPWATPVKIVGSPQAVGGQTFEQVSYGGLTGWVPLNSFQSFTGI